MQISGPSSGPLKGDLQNTQMWLNGTTMQISGPHKLSGVSNRAEGPYVWFSCLFAEKMQGTTNPHRGTTIPHGGTTIPHRGTTNPHN